MCITFHFLFYLQVLNLKMDEALAFLVVKVYSLLIYHKKGVHQDHYILFRSSKFYLAEIMAVKTPKTLTWQLQLRKLQQC